MHRRALVAAASAAAVLADRAHARAVLEETADVDMLLVLAVDCSSSIDDAEARLQREGYRAAFEDAAVQRRIAAGAHGAIGVAYVEWSGIEFQRLLLPWARIGGPAEARGWSEALMRHPLVPGARRRGTSLSGALDFARMVLAEAPWGAARRVVDVSGDGANNSGPSPEEARDRSVAEGITVNALAIEGSDPAETWLPPGIRLAEYYRATVIGGGGAFVAEAEGFDDFAAALRRKLVRELSGRIGTA
ncbi:DUF1194 domain-containing protein [Falsiroseomonas oryzae]|uniref:DUF1194 domain-containing protein n=1 Tax=Falsiroseomonas oryzae TaxID=2766473 RepID=UPI0022EA4AFD|nr:DUF1194 domain-containing protein [Roseomonas sp. MO-31]